MIDTLHIHTLGGLFIERREQLITGFDQRKAQALLVYLACTNTPHPRESLAELFWEGRTQAQALSNLRVALTNLRQTVGPFVEITRETAGMQPDSAWGLDVMEFEALLDNSTGTMTDLTAAADLYRGSFLDGFYVESLQFEEWVLLERERLRFRAIVTFDNLIEQHTASRDYGAAIDIATALLRLDNLREETHRALMMLYAQSNQRNRALAQYDTLRQLLADELGVEPMREAYTLYEQIRSGSFELWQPLPISVPDDPIKHHLPVHATEFIGRETEVAHLIAQIQDAQCRLVTVVGPGGIGKTRLALTVADRIKTNFAQGAHFIALAHLTTPEEIAPAIITTLEFPHASENNSPDNQLLDALSNQQILLVLDNFEHLLAGAALVEQMLTAIPGLVIIATSHEALNVEWECAYEVYGLALPPNDEAELESFDALRLFAERARRVQPTFRLANERAYALEICRQVEGMPLGIELAASWLRVLSCEEIINELFDLENQLRHGADRHRSLRAVFEQTWDRLSQREQKTLMMLAIFRGGFTREAAETVSGATLPILAALVNKSLVQRDPATSRFALHGLWHHYATEHLHASSPDHEQAEAQHSAYYAALVDRHASAIRAGQTQPVLRDIENVQAAWQHAVAHGSAALLRQFIDGVSWLYELQGWYRDAIGMFEPATAALRSSALSGDAGIAYGRLLGLLGWFKGRSGNRQLGYQLVQEGIAILHNLGAHEEIALTQLLLGRLADTDAEIAAAYQLCEESLRHLNGGSLSRIASAHIALAELANALGNHTAAQHHAQQGENINRAINNPRGYAGAVQAQGDVAAALGDHAAAEQRYLDSLSTYQELGYRQGIIWSLRGLGRLAFARNNNSAAWGYFREALEIAVDLELTPQMLDIALSLAELLVRQGEWGRVAEIVLLARRHRTASTDTQAAASRILAEYEAELTPHMSDLLTRPAERQLAIQLDLMIAELLDSDGSES